MKLDEALKPVLIESLSSQRIMPDPHHLPNLVQQLQLWIWQHPRPTPLARTIRRPWPIPFTLTVPIPFHTFPLVKNS
jgi:hypothetical protein